MPVLKRAVDVAEARAPERTVKRAKVWHDNEKFLLCPDSFQRSELVQVRFLLNSGDLNPIETCRYATKLVRKKTNKLVALNKKQLAYQKVIIKLAAGAAPQSRPRVHPCAKGGKIFSATKLVPAPILTLILKRHQNMFLLERCVLLS